MTNSIFKNFNPEDRKNYTGKGGVTAIRNLDSLIAAGIRACTEIGKFSVTNGSKFQTEHGGYSVGNAQWHPVNNDRFLYVASVIKYFAMQEIKKIPKFNLEAPNERRRVTMMISARNGNNESTGVHDSDLYAITGLFLIDDALTALDAGGSALAYGDALIEASKLIFMGNKFQLTQKLKPEVTKIEKAKRKKSAITGFEGTAQGKAKTAIYECWKLRETGYSKYGGRTALAKKMHGLYPVIETLKSITDWFGIWDKANALAEAEIKAREKIKMDFALRNVTFRIPNESDVALGTSKA